LSKHVDFVGKKTLNFLFELNTDIFGSDPGINDSLSPAGLTRIVDRVAQPSSPKPIFIYVNCLNFGRSFRRARHMTMAIARVTTKRFQQHRLRAETTSKEG